MSNTNVTLYIANKIKEFREIKNITQQELAEALNTTQQSIARYESGERKTTHDILFSLADYFNISINDFFPPLNFDNANITNISSNTIKIPVLGAIKAGIPVEAQENIIEYAEIPAEWVAGGKTFFGLKVDGDSMLPKYQPNDTVIFEQNSDSLTANNKDCAVMVNGDDATFKKIMISEKGVTLVPYNIEYEPLFFTPEEVENKPVRIIGIAREKRTKII